MKLLLILLLLIPVLMASDEHKSEQSHEEGKDLKKAQALREIVKGNTEFAINYFKHVTSVSSKDKNSPPKNVVFSPVSISSVFSMLSLGARSKTHQEIWEGLSLNNTHCEEEEVHQAYSNLLQVLNEPKSSLQVNIGNAIFLDNKVTLLKSFKDDAQRHYHAEVMQDDFLQSKEVENKINEYVKNKTEGKIEKLIDGLSESSKMVLLNYVLFKGEWQNTFISSSTYAEHFFVDHNTTVDVPMMHKRGGYKAYYDTKLPCTVVELPYKDGASMIIAIANPGKIHEVEQGLSADTIQRWRTLSKPRLIDLAVPKYSISSTIDLGKDLSEFGIKTAFSGSADFSGITHNATLKVGKAVHKAVLDVDEKGTVAAGASGVEIVLRAGITMISVNRPFISIIFEQSTNSILFMATVMNPAEK
ncbi:serine protease inhibitor A3L-like [Mantella aurantiaca]